MKKKLILSVLVIMGITQFGNVSVFAMENRNIDNISQSVERSEYEKYDDGNISQELKEQAKLRYSKEDLMTGENPTTEVLNEDLQIIDKHLKWNGDLNLTNNPKTLILHHIEASRPNSTIPVEDVHSWHLANGWAGIGYHFYITKDGTIYKGRPENAIGAHAYGNNVDSLGIAVEGKYNSEEMTDAQEEAVIKLGKHLRKKYNADNIKGHGEVTATDCPGDKYPLEHIKAEILKDDIVDTNSYAWKKVDGKYYYQNTVTNEIKKSQWIIENGNHHYLTSDGVMATGWTLVDNDWYYLDDNGYMQVGWQEVGGSWYYLNDDGSMQTGWKEVYSKWYYFDGSGYMKSDWNYIDGAWYYLNTDGSMYRDDFLNIDGNTFYLNAPGNAHIGWKQIGLKWYYFDGNGYMQKGWEQIYQDWYYFDNNGEMLVNGEYSLYGTNYTFDGNGVWINN